MMSPSQFKKISLLVVLLCATTRTTFAKYKVTKEGTFDAATTCGYGVTAYLTCDHEFELERDKGDVDVKELDCELSFCYDDDEKNSKDECYTLDTFEPSFSGASKSQFNDGPYIFSLNFYLNRKVTLPNVATVRATADIEYDEDYDYPFIKMDIDVDFDCTASDPPTKSPTMRPTSAPTSAPTKSPEPTITPEPTSSPTDCRNVVGWTDRFGDGCEWYESRDPPGCPNIGSKYGNNTPGPYFGLYAKDACCYCKQ